MRNEPILPTRRLGGYIWASVGRDNQIVVSVRIRYYPGSLISLGPEMQQALCRYMDDLRLAASNGRNTSEMPILKSRRLGCNVLGDEILVGVDKGDTLVLVVRVGRRYIQDITLEPKVQQALRQYIDDLQRAIEQRNVGPNAAAQNTAYGANDAANSLPELTMNCGLGLHNGNIADAFIRHLKYIAALVEPTDLPDVDWFTANKTACEIQTKYGRKISRSLTSYLSEKHIARVPGFYAMLEILTADLMREDGQPFQFLPMFGFADEQHVLASTNKDQAQ